MLDPVLPRSGDGVHLGVRRLGGLGVVHPGLFVCHGGPAYGPPVGRPFT